MSQLLLAVDFSSLCGVVGVNVGSTAVQAGGAAQVSSSQRGPLDTVPTSCWTVLSLNMERELTSLGLFPGLDMWDLSHLHVIS